MMNLVTKLQLRDGRSLIMYVVVVLCVAGLEFQPRQAFGQSYSQTSRAFVQSSGALAMGDAGVALPGTETIFFYNPAHLSSVAGTRPQFTLLGIRGSVSNNFFDQLTFFEDELMPAIDEGLETMSNDDLRAFYDETLALGRRRTIVNGDLLLPSAIAKINGIGFGAGAFGHSSLHYRFENAGAGVPHIDFTAIGDFIFVGSGSFDFARIGVDGLAAGLSGKVTNRWLTLKNKPIDAIGSDEDILILKATALGFDAGLQYDVGFFTLPGDLMLAAAAYDVVGSGYDYEYSSGTSDEGELNAELIAEEEDQANTLYALHPSYRVGAAYLLPQTLPAVFKNTAIALDYLWYSHPNVPQQSLSHVHLGAQTQVGFFVLRGGLNSGYTTFGAGLHLGMISIDYAFYGVEQGRFPGQLGSWNHSAQIGLGL